jgi:hypothetical protein
VRVLWFAEENADRFRKAELRFWLHSDNPIPSAAVFSGNPVDKANNSINLNRCVGFHGKAKIEESAGFVGHNVPLAIEKLGCWTLHQLAIRAGSEDNIVGTERPIGADNAAVEIDVFGIGTTPFNNVKSIFLEVVQNTDFYPSALRSAKGITIRIGDRCFSSINFSKHTGVL